MFVLHESSDLCKRKILNINVIELFFSVFGPVLPQAEPKYLDLKYIRLDVGKIPADRAAWP
jgi:hypothetical protein